MNDYVPTASYTLVYILVMHDKAHEGLYKVGKASLSTFKSEQQLPPCCEELMEAAKKRIDEYTRTALIRSGELLYTELAIRHLKLQDGTDFVDHFIDDDIHDILKRSGYRPIVFQDTGRDSEWFPDVNVEIIKEAISAYKKGLSILPKRSELPALPLKPKKEKEFKLREEQECCVNKTLKCFEDRNEMLWDCKMRFGKTVTSYELIKRMFVKKVIVVTHRPAVQDSWDTDFNLIFKDSNYRFIDKTHDVMDGYDEIIDSKNDKILLDLVTEDIPFVYFASIQDLRGSKRVGGNFNKNNTVFDMDWDLLIIDEAHEGTQTDLGAAVIKELRKKDTKVLSLTGTAYNLLHKYGDNVFTWTYVDEQSAKKEWEKLHPYEKNPYADLPKMNILTFDISDKISESYRYVTEDSAFNFREFFRTWTGNIDEDFQPMPNGTKIGDFVHEDAVWSFLNLITRNDSSTNYPFSKPEYLDMFKHTFWLVPGVKEAKALSSLLKHHPVFGENNTNEEGKAIYGIVNVAGDGDDEESLKALDMVRQAIKKYDRTITISCQRLTTGITVKEWTAIMMLSGSSSTAVNQYMQAIFRVQSPGIIDGKRKENCYVFDFAPDRALKVIGEIHQLSHKSTGDNEESKKSLGQFLNFCPVISVEGTEMREYDVPDMMRQIKRISVEDAINSGFDDNSIYIADAGLKRTDLDLEILRKLKDVVLPKKRGQKDKSVLINAHGMTDEQRSKANTARKKKKAELTDEERNLLKQLKEEKKAQKELFDLLRAVSIRLPLLFYGADADITKILHLKDFVEIVDDESWEEFLPKGLKKDLFLKISKYYDEDVLVGAGLRIRKLAKAADEYPPNIRTKKIVEIISKFRNPDKETVLTPWRVVNMHLGTAIGGYNFFNESFEKETEDVRFIDKEVITSDIFKPDTKILELNSKSGLYPLYVANTLYNQRLNKKESEYSFEELRDLWRDVLKTNIFILCKTKMAKSITTRTLAGYSDMPINAIYLSKLVEERMKDLHRLSNKITNPETWGLKGNRMKFDAVVGNPPYQNGNQQIYVKFYLTAIQTAKYVSMIFPSTWQNPKTANGLNLMNTPDVKGDKQIVFIDNRQNVFKGITGAEWVNIILWKENYNNCLDGKQLIYTNGENKEIKKLLWDYDDIDKPRELIELFNCVNTEDFVSLQEITSARKPYGFAADIVGNYEKYNVEAMNESKMAETDITLYEKKENKMYLPIDYKLPKVSPRLKRYKVFVAKAWGNMDEKKWLGGAYSDVILASPYDICTETYLESGCFDDYETSLKHSKYLLTQFTRALFYLLKFSQNSTQSWGKIPQQNYSEPWWNETIEKINEHLFDKYNVPKNIRDFVNNNIQFKDESNIRNLKEKK